MKGMKRKIEKCVREKFQPITREQNTEIQREIEMESNEDESVIGWLEVFNQVLEFVQQEMRQRYGGELNIHSF